MRDCCLSIHVTLLRIGDLADVFVYECVKQVSTLNIHLSIPLYREQGEHDVIVLQHFFLQSGALILTGLRNQGFQNRHIYQWQISSNWWNILGRNHRASQLITRHSKPTAAWKTFPWSEVELHNAALQTALMTTQGLKVKNKQLQAHSLG